MVVYGLPVGIVIRQGEERARRSPAASGRNGAGTIRISFCNVKTGRGMLIKVAAFCRTYVAEIPAPLGSRRHALIKFERRAFVSVFFGNKEKRLVFLCIVNVGDVERSAQG